MKRLLTLASAGLFATGLAIFPVSVFAQPNATAGTDTKAQMTAPVAGHDAKTVPSHDAKVVPSHDAKAMPSHDAKVMPSHDAKVVPTGKEAASQDAAKAKPPTKDADKAGAATSGSVKAVTPAAPASTPAKVGG